MSDRLDIGQGQQGKAGIVYYEPLTSGNVDAGLVNPLFHVYGRRYYDFKNLDYMTTSGIGTPIFAKVTYSNRIKTSTAINDTAVIDVFGSVESYPITLFRRNRKFEFFCYFIPMTDGAGTSNFELEVGLAYSLSFTGTQTTGYHCMIQYKSGISSNFIASCANGTTQTTTIIGMAIATATECLIAIINNESTKFYVNGMLTATHIANLPGATTTLLPFFFIKTLANAARQANILLWFAWSDDQT